MRELEQTILPCFEAYAARTSGPIGLAVSGGGDSLALLYLAVRWARHSGQQLFCLTVDHGLRAEAVEEARGVGRHCKALGVSHRILKWTPGGKSVGQARSRRARHALLAEATRTAGSNLLFMGHTADDQVETLIMREAREETAFGLAGIRSFAVSPVWPEGRDVNIGRPLLGSRRGILRDYLRELDVRWVDDPSNEDHRYERVRVRETVVNEAQGNDLVRLMSTAHSMQQARTNCDARLANWFREGVSVHDEGVIKFDPLAVSSFELNLEQFCEGLAWLLMCVAGHDRRPNRESRMALARDILAIPHGFQARTLGGAWIAPRKKRVTLARDPGRAPNMPQVIKAGDIWDGRFVFRENPVSDCAVNTLIKKTKNPDKMDVAPMARETYPLLEGGEFEVGCLIRQRLNQVVFMFDYDNLINQTIKNSSSPSLQAE